MQLSGDHATNPTDAFPPVGSIQNQAVFKRERPVAEIYAHIEKLNCFHITLVTQMHTYKQESSVDKNSRHFLFFFSINLTYLLRFFYIYVVMSNELQRNLPEPIDFEFN